MSGFEFVLIALAAVLGGAVNALAGGGTLITFPMLTAVGIPTVSANITNTVALCPGYLGGTIAQWRDLRGHERRLWFLVPAGVLGGITNVPGTPLALYFQALGLPKAEFVRAVALTFLVLKLSQFGAVWQVGLMEPRLLALSAGATVLALAAFRVGLWAQDRVPAATFNRAVLAFLGFVSVAMLVRALRP